MTCTPDNCIRWNKLFATYDMAISSCDLEGIYKGQPFVVKNFSTTPEPDLSACSELQHWRINKKNHYAILRQEDENNCENHYHNASKQCSDAEYSKNLRVSSQEERQAANREYSQCIQNAESEQQACYRTYSTVNVTELDLLGERAGGLAPWLCQQRLDIPVAGQDTGPGSGTATGLYLPRRPVESLYCSFLDVFGARC